MSNGSAPPGIPEGLPQEMWLEYLRIQSHERIQLKQIELAQVQVQVNLNPPPGYHGNCGPGKIRVPKLKESDDIDVFSKSI